MTYYRFAVPTPAPITNLRREMDRLFEEVFAGRVAGNWQPSVSAREDAEGYSLDIDLPGVPVASVEVLTEDGVLTVRGERATRNLSEGERSLLTETPSGRFVRQFRLPKAANLESIQAAYENGVLSVRIAKVSPPQPRRVPVSMGSLNVVPAAAPTTTAVPAAAASAAAASVTNAPANASSPEPEPKPESAQA